MTKEEKKIKINLTHDKLLTNQCGKNPFTRKKHSLNLKIDIKSIFYDILFIIF